ncbi:hypothetical protein ACSBR1_030301 [Camellia fascicularis]
MTFLANALPSHFLSFRAFLLCLIILALPIFFAYGAFASSLTGKQGSEAMALLTWKASLHNQSQTLLPSGVGSNHCSWVGIGCNKAGRVSHIDLHGYGLKGNLVNLTTLYLYDNQLSGSIPQEVGMLRSPLDLELSRNNLTGSISTSIGNLSNLITLYLHDNQLSGSISQEFGMLRSLFDVELSGNNLMGSIPPSIGNLGNLTTL